MAGTDYDVIVGSYKLKVARREEGGYRRRFARREIQQQLLSQADDPVIQSRSDRAAFYQNSWVGGAAWWKPLMTPSLSGIYYRGNHMDVWSQPGQVVPLNSQTDSAESNLHEAMVAVMAETAGGTHNLHAIGSTTTEDSTHWDVYVYSSGSWVRDTGLHSGGQGTPIDAVYDPDDKYVYVIWSDNELTRFKPSTNAEDAAWITYSTTHVGASIMKHQGSVMVYLDGKLYTVDKATPNITQVANDGMGPEFLNQMAEPASAIAQKWQINLATATPSGIYYVKNVFEGAQPTPWVFRVDKDAAGNWIVNPLAPLPRGNVALDITHHLGSVFITTSPEWGRILDNAASADAEVTVFQYTDGQPGAVGSILGSTEVDETPFKYLGSIQGNLYIGGHKRLWVYDAVRGGIHAVQEWATALTDGPYRIMSNIGNQRIFLGKNRMSRQTVQATIDPETVASFGDDETTYTLESSYFDFGMPMEQKELTKVEIQRDKDDGTSEWTVQVAADDGSFTDVLTDSGTAAYASADLSGTTGRRFRYKLIYQTTGASRKPLAGLKFTATSGDMVQEWQLLIDGDEILNVDNEVQDEQTFYDNMVTLAQTSTTTTLRDNMQEQAQETETDATAIRVKVVAVEIIKEKPGESLVNLVLRED